MPSGCHYHPHAPYRSLGDGWKRCDGDGGRCKYTTQGKDTSKAERSGRKWKKDDETGDKPS